MPKIVHLDLKGAPPRPEFFKELFPFIKQHYADGILLEYEDMFPYKGSLKNARHGNAYTVDDVKMINQLAAENSLFIMPLGTTYKY
jgi:hexosaminidase